MLTLKFPSICSFLVFKNISKRAITYQSSKQVFEEYFGMNDSSAEEFITKNKLQKLTPEKIVEVTELCKSLGFSKTDVLKYPRLLKSHVKTIDNYYQIMKEAGFRKITANHVVKFRQLRGKSVLDLKAQNYLQKNANVAQNFISYLVPRPENFNIKKYDETDSLDEIHYNILTTYLKWRLNATDADIAHLLVLHYSVQRKSFAYLCENIKTVEECGFSKEKILKNGYVLQAYPKHVKQLMEQYPTIGSICIKKAIRMYPKFLNVTSRSIERTLQILKEHKISHEAVSRNLNVFHLSLATLERRLQNMKQEADFKVNLHHPNILKLVVHHNRAKDRLEFLKKLQLKCAGVKLLGENPGQFDDHIKEGKDAITFMDLYSFIRGTFKNVENFESTLRKHPYYLQIPLTRLEDTYNFLLSLNFSNAAIIEAICVLLYPREKIRDALIQVKEVEENRTLTQVQKLNLVLYLIEKECHFTGDGVWMKSGESEHIEELNSEV